MNYEQKYNELIKAIKELRDLNPSDEGIQNWVNDNVPELKDSEDERIRKSILSGLKYLETELGWDAVGDVDILDAYDWLEKQGMSYTKKDVDDAYLKGVNDAKNEIEKQYEASYQIRKDIATFIFNYRGDIKDRAKWMDYLGVRVYVFEKEDEKQKDKPVLEAVPCKYIDEIKDWLEMQDEKSQDEDEQVMKE